MMKKGKIKLSSNSVTEPACNATDWNYDCCTSLRPCGIGKGDCDSDDDCVGNLSCGIDNCPSSFSSDADCCMGRFFNQKNDKKL